MIHETINEAIAHPKTTASVIGGVYAAASYLWAQVPHSVWSSWADRGVAMLGLAGFAYATFVIVRWLAPRTEDLFKSIKQTQESIVLMLREIAHHSEEHGKQLDRMTQLQESTAQHNAQIAALHERWVDAAETLARRPCGMHTEEFRTEVQRALGQAQKRIDE